MAGYSAEEREARALAKQKVKQLAPRNQYARVSLRRRQPKDGHGVPVSLAEQIALIPGGMEEFHKILRVVPLRDKTFEELVRCYFQLPDHSQNAPQLENMCVTMGASWAALLGVCVEVAVERQIPMTRFIASMWMPAVMERNIQEALTSKGFKDREAFMVSTGILPTPKGSTVNILNQANASGYTDKGELSGLPPFEESIISLSEVIRDAVDVVARPVEPPLELPVMEEDV